ncbi:MAG: hypothetical protein ACOC9C_00740 [Chloroflexota bacterium]
MIRFRQWTGIGVLLLLVLLVSGCQDSGPDPCNEEGTLFTDDFSPDRECGWALYNRSGAVAEIEEGALRMSTSQPGQIWWTNPGRSFDDVVITANATLVSGPQDNAMGLICRYQSSENFYVFLISSDGYYAIGKYQSGNNQITYLTGDGQYAPSEAINQGQASNTIRATCIGDELTLTVNGQMVDSANDPTFVTGDIGVGVSTFQPGSLEVAFDDVRVLAP